MSEEKVLSDAKNAFKGGGHMDRKLCPTGRPQIIAELQTKQKRDSKRA